MLADLPYGWELVCGSLGRLFVFGMYVGVLVIIAVSFFYAAAFVSQAFVFLFAAILGSQLGMPLNKEADSARRERKRREAGVVKRRTKLAGTALSSTQRTRKARAARAHALTRAPSRAVQPVECVPKCALHGARLRQESIFSCCGTRFALASPPPPPG